MALATCEFEGAADIKGSSFVERVPLSYNLIIAEGFEWDEYGVECAMQAIAQHILTTKGKELELMAQAKRSVLGTPEFN